MSENKDPEDENAPKSTDAATNDGADVVPIDQARQKAAAAAEAAASAANPSGGAASPAGTKLNEFLAPVMAAIAKELAGLADADGVVRMGDDSEANRRKAAVVVKGLGEGISNAINQAFGKWAFKIETGEKGETGISFDKTFTLDKKFNFGSVPQAKPTAASTTPASNSSTENAPAATDAPADPKPPGDDKPSN